MKNRLKILVFLLTFAFLLQSFSPIFVPNLDSIEIAENEEESSLKSKKDLKIIFSDDYFFFIDLNEKKLLSKVTFNHEKALLEAFYEVNVPPPRI